MTRPLDGPASDGARSYDLGIAAIRERCIRRGQVAPRPGDADEQRWAREGDRPISQLDTVRGER